MGMGASQRASRGSSSSSLWFVPTSFIIHSVRGDPLSPGFVVDAICGFLVLLYLSVFMVRINWGDSMNYASTTILPEYLWAF